MIGYVRKDTKDYEIEYSAFDTNKVANYEKAMPATMITEDGLFVTDEFIKYARPLIRGQMPIQYTDGILETL